MKDESNKVIADQPSEYIAQLKPKQRQDLAFLQAELEKYWDSHPKIMRHLFSVCMKLASADKSTVDKLEALKMRWEIEQEDDSEIEAILGNSATKKPVKKTKTTTKIAWYQRYVDIVSKFQLQVFVIFPVIIFAIYLVLIATPRYESQALLVIKQPDGMSTMEPSLALLSGLGGSAPSVDTDLVSAYISSNDMLAFLDTEIAYSEHFQHQSSDIFSKLDNDATREQRLTFFNSHVSVEIDMTSSIITVHAQAFDPEYARLITQTIAQRAEFFINKIGHDLANAQLSFVKNEHELVQNKLQNAQNRLLAFQREHNLLDPEAEGLALQQITFGLEASIASKNAELNALRSSMSESAPMVRKVLGELESLENQLLSERQRLTNRNGEIGTAGDSGALGVNQILTRFSDYKIDLEFALQAYTASKISLEKSRIQAYQQLKYLVVIESPTLPEESAYPKVFYNVALLFAVLLALWAIVKLILATAKELI